jgi:hypothetical protein
MKGLYQKYDVKKTDGTPVDPNAEYFVLRVDKDPHARKAVRVYASSIRSENPTLMNELRAWLDNLQINSYLNERDS